MFGLLESSRTRAQPLELYKFEVAGRVYAYCNGDDDFVYGSVIGPDAQTFKFPNIVNNETVLIGANGAQGDATSTDQVYKAVPITHSRITSSGTLDRATLQVSIADNTELAALLRGYPRSDVMLLTLRQGHKDDPDGEFLVAWVGRVLSAKADAGTRLISCQPSSTSLKRSGLRRNWQYPCPHALYGPQCRASQPHATVSVGVVSANKNTVIVPDGWNGGKPVAKFAGGLATWTAVDGSAEVRTILRAVDLPDATSAITLGGPAVIPAGAVIALSLGCDHLRDDCSTLHVPSDEADYGGGNIRNFGGQPFIPTKNPIGFVNNY